VQVGASRLVEKICGKGEIRVKIGIHHFSSIRENAKLFSL